jgi:hypothetical protein
MIKLGRNDACPCGSGKKYKKCCLVSADEVDFQYRRMRQVEAGLIPKLTKFAFEILGPEVVEDAWRDFNGERQVEGFDPESSMNMVFVPGFCSLGSSNSKLRGLLNSQRRLSPSYF